MPRQADSLTTIVFFGLEEPLAAELESVLCDSRRTVHSQPLSTVSECREAIAGLRADLVFCPADGHRYRLLLEAVKEARPDLPVVVVSRHPLASEWLDALEDGAADYCTAPFETRQVQWILESCLVARHTEPA